LSQFCKSRFDAREYWGLSELGKYPVRLSEMLEGKRTLFLGLVKQAKDHLGAAYVVPGWIEMRIRQKLRSQSANTG
jgi:hypothetical protein